MSTIDVHFSSALHDWATPPDLFESLDRRFRFTLDVCASSWNAKCERFFSEKEDGLAQAWSGRCFMNPPYGRAISKWMAKAYREATNGRCSVVCLVPARVDTSWWWQYAIRGSIEHLKGRLRFVRPDGAADAAPFPSALVIFDCEIARNYVSYGEKSYLEASRAYHLWCQEHGKYWADVAEVPCPRCVEQPSLEGVR